MAPSKLIATLRSLNKRELSRFQEYVNTPYFNKQSDVSGLLNQLVVHAPDYPAENIQKEKVFATLFPDKAYHQQRMREVMAGLYRLLRNYLAQLNWEQTEYAQELAALDQYRKRGLDGVFQKELNAIRKKLATNQQLESAHYFTEFELARIANLHFGQQQRRVHDTSLQEKADSLDTWFLYLQLMESCEMLNRKQVMGTAYEPGILAHLDTYLAGDPAPMQHAPPIRIYYQVQRLLLYQEIEDYHQLVDLLDQWHEHLHPGEARNLYKHAQNYCIRKINAGEPSFSEELFNLYRRLLENQLILTSEQIIHTDYKNIVTVGIRLGETEWVKEFIENYHPLVAQPHRENVYHFSLANLYAETGQNRRAIRLLQSVTFTDTFYQVSARMLLLRVYYETEEWDLAYYQIESFKLFLKRNKDIAPDTRNNHLVFLRLYKRLIQLQERQFFLKKSDFLLRLEKIYSQFEMPIKVSNRQWLASKLSEIASKG